MPEPIETELALAPRNDDVRVPPIAPALAEDATPNPIELVLDRLHGRWLWVALLAAVLAPGLAAAGYFLTPVVYSAQGLVTIKRQLDPITGPTPETANMGDFSGFVTEQTVHLRSDRVIEAALGDPRLEKVPAFAKRIAEQQAGAISSGLSAVPVKGTGFISVQIDSDDPAFAAAAVNSLLDAYKTVAAPNAKVLLESKIGPNRENLTAARRQIETANNDLLTLIKESPYGTANLQGVIEDRVTALQKKESEIASIDAAMQRIKDSLPAGSEPAPDARLAPTAIDLDQANPGLPAMRREIEQTRMQLELASKSYSPNHPIYKNVQKKLDILNGQIDKESAAALETWNAGPGRSFRYGELSAVRAQAMEARKLLRDDINALNQTIARADAIKRSLAQSAEDEKRFSERLKELEAEAKAIEGGRIDTSPAVAPSQPSKDRRKQIAVAGGVGGIALSFAFFFLWGTLDKRTFGTRQLAGADPGRLLCAGAIPDMNAMQEDAESKDLASNCVHRIRTRIESRRTAGDGYALMVSSPFQGDGKTTLAVALAWSYAESGYRTLLVDCDFIGQALSFQFGQLGSAGVREALQGADPLSMVASAGGESLWILPVGRDRHFGASRVHPTGLRRLFRELRNRYDIIIVDTGPMTASIEALPVASSVDGVVLSLRRGRSRQRLDECIADIGSVGAEYLGVVLNYADRKDCMRYGSVSRMSADVTRAMDGKLNPPPAHPLLSAMSARTVTLASGEQRREGDAA